MTQDLKAQIVDTLKRLQGTLEGYIYDSGDVPYSDPMCNDGMRLIELLTDPNVFVGRWKTDMSKAPERDECLYALSYSEDCLSVSGYVGIEKARKYCWSSIYKATAWAHLPPAPKKEDM